ncbi:MAG: hypothetical protein H0X18_12655 [Geodermatophilaceae bacterium]|nr:hypothetical protein [Geodermatophilaceae bacterium]
MAAQRRPPVGLRGAPFRGSVAISSGLLSAKQLRGSAYVRIFRDVYVDARIERDHQLRCEAAVLLMPCDGVLAGRSAAAAYGIRDVIDDEAPVQVAVPPGRRFGPIRGLAIRTAALPPADIARRWPPRTTLLRATLDIARESDQVESVVALDRILHCGSVPVDRLRSAVESLPACRGSARARTAVAAADGRSESPPETRTRLIMRAAGLRPEPQYTVRDPSGAFVARVDLALVAQRVAVEYEGAWHWQPGQLAADRRRLDRLTAAGWRVVHVTAADLHNPAAMLARINAVLALLGS